MEQMEAKQFVTRKTSEQMADESKKATEEGMRVIAEALKAKTQAPPLDVPESDITQTSDSEAEIIVTKTRRCVSKKKCMPSQDTDKLETRIHYLKLDNSNLIVENTDLKHTNETLANRLNLFTTIDTHLTIIKELITSSQNNNSQLTDSQLSSKIQHFDELMTSHIVTINNVLTQIPLKEVRNVFHVRLIDERVNAVKVHNELAWLLTKKMVINALIASIIYGSFILSILSLFYVFFAM